MIDFIQYLIDKIWEWTDRHLAISAAIFSVLFFTVGVFIFCWDNGSHHSTLSDFGQFVSGVFGSLLSVITIVFVVRGYLHQKADSLKNEIENRVFKMIEFHRENVNEVLISITDSSETKLAGRKAFIRMVEDFEDIRCIITNTDVIVGFKDSYTRYDGFETAFMILCFGLNSTSSVVKSQILENVILKEGQTVDDCYYAIRLKLITKFQNTPKAMYWCLFNGYEYVISHYFRTLFEIVRYIDSQSELTSEDKYRYATILRSNLSAFEQTMLFIHANTEKGKYWEANYINRNVEKWYVTKYNLIRNMNLSFSALIDVQRAFPLVDFEFLPIHRRVRIAADRKEMGFFYYEELFQSKR